MESACSRYKLAKQRLVAAQEFISLKTHCFGENLINFFGNDAFSWRGEVVVSDLWETFSQIFSSWFGARKFPELQHDIFEQILEKLPVKSLVRFKSVSKQWKSIIEARYFQEKQLIVSQQQSQNPQVLLTNLIETSYILGQREEREKNILRILTLNPLNVVKLPTLCPPSKNVILDNGSDFPTHDKVCRSLDGLICYYNEFNGIHVVNPMTRWSRSIPHAGYQQAVFDMMNKYNWKGNGCISLWDLGFGKDKFTNIYKLVWLYNSFELNLENTTTCEVFEFSTNTWRYVMPAPCRILDDNNPVYLDGSLHWFTDESILETRILSFDLHTEKFQIIAKAPFVHAPCKQIIMCNLNNHLCVAQKMWPRQEIWSLENSDMTWEKIYSLEFPSDSCWFSRDHRMFVLPCVIPLMIMKNKKKLLLFDVRAVEPSLVIYDPELKSYELCFQLDYKPCWTHGTALSYVQSLISI